MIRLLWMLALAGCSFFGTEKARRSTSGRIVCTSSYVAPVIDTVFGLAGFVTVVALASYRMPEGSTTNDGEQIAQGWALILSIPTVLHIAGATYGFNQTANCRCAERRQIAVE